MSKFGLKDLKTIHEKALRRSEELKQQHKALRLHRQELTSQRQDIAAASRQFVALSGEVVKLNNELIGSKWELIECNNRIARLSENQLNMFNKFKSFVESLADPLTILQLEFDNSADNKEMSDPQAWLSMCEATQELVEKIRSFRQSELS